MDDRNSQAAKELEEITQNDIKDAAIIYADQFDVRIKRDECTVTEIVNEPRTAEIEAHTNKTLTPTMQ